MKEKKVDSLKKRFSERRTFWLIGSFLLLIVHLFLYFKIGLIFSKNSLRYLLAAWFILFSSIPFFIFGNKKKKNDKSSGWPFWVGGYYTLFIFILSLFLLFFDLFMIIGNVYFMPGKIFLLAFFLALFLLALGIVQANNIQTTFLKIVTTKLPIENSPLRIVQLTDLHLGPWMSNVRLKKIVRKINELSADIIVITGDSVDGLSGGQKVNSELLSELKASLAVYAVTGNHDYYEDIESILAILKSSGIQILKREAVEIGGIIIAGVSDSDHLIKSNWGLSRSEEFILSLERRQKVSFLLLLRHRPIVEDGSEGHFDLQLSGHTHGGQFFPAFSSHHIIPGRSRGFRKLKNGELLYVNNGVGHIGPPFRFMAPPEITVIDIERVDS